MEKAGKHLKEGERKDRGQMGHLCHHQQVASLGPGSFFHLNYGTITAFLPPQGTHENSPGKAYEDALPFV